MTIPRIPRRSLNTTYPAGANPWSGALSQVAPDGDYENNGWTPNAPVKAEYENYYHAGIKDSLSHVRRVAYARVTADNSDNTSHALARHFTDSRRLLRINGTSNRYVYSPDFRRSQSATAVPSLKAFAIKGAESRASVAMVGMFQYGAAGAAGAIDAFTDATTPVRSQVALPNASAIYTDACMDESTGRFVALAGMSVATANVGFASGDLNGVLAFSAVAIGVAWTPRPTFSVASKPGETRAFHYNYTFRTTDGGVTANSFQTVGYTGGLPSGNLFPPTWDANENRWICSIAKLDTSAANSASNSKIYTSTNGETWAFLANAPTGVVITHIKEHRGWLWAIGRVLPDLSPAGHGGLEVFFSEDGGSTWRRPGVVLSLHSRAFSATDQEHYHHGSSIVAMGPHLLFQTIVSHADYTGAGFVSGTAGRAVESVVITVDTE